jgi:hypothetical protein
MTGKAALSTRDDKPAKDPAPLAERARRNCDEAVKAYESRADRPEAKLERRPGRKGYVRSAVDGDEGALLLRQLHALGTTSIPFLDETLGSLLRVLQDSNGDVSAKSYNAAIAVFCAVEPQNELEALLAAQMIAANEGALRCAGTVGQSQMINQIEAFGSLANKFMRTFVAQVEALGKLRRGGEQTVKVVHIHKGGQAVVADTFNQGGGPNAKSDEQPYGTGVPARRAALPGPDPTRDGMPLPGDAKRPLSPARRQKSRRSEGE